MLQTDHWETRNDKFDSQKSTPGRALVVDLSRQIWYLWNRRFKLFQNLYRIWAESIVERNGGLLKNPNFSFWPHHSHGHQNHVTISHLSYIGGNGWWLLVDTLSELCSLCLHWNSLVSEPDPVLAPYRGFGFGAYMTSPCDLYSPYMTTSYRY